MYSIVDVETTGGYKEGNKITEIAIVTFDGNKLIDQYSTLINPERSIPFGITKLTGITNDMVAKAPKFYEVAKVILEKLEGTTFVAHNVFFDYKFIQREFLELGYSFKSPKLCTVRMARKLIPGHKSYSLGKICKDLNIKILNRHRALGDALATTELFKIILNNSEDISDFDESKLLVLPASLSRKVYDELPQAVGVYYFYDNDGLLLYIGKSKNIKKRVTSHLRVDVKNKRDLKLKSEMAHIDYMLTGSELAALLIENSEIKLKQPLYNRQLRKKNYHYGLLLRENLNSEIEICYERKESSKDYLYSFSNRRKAVNKINIFYQSIIGCEKDSMHFEMFKHKTIKKLSLKHYNRLVEKVFYSGVTKDKDYGLELKGRVRGEVCTLQVENRFPLKLIYQNENDRFIYEFHQDEEAKNILQRYRVRKAKVSKNRKVDKRKKSIEVMP